jgi:hypothetical protein
MIRTAHGQRVELRYRRETRPAAPHLARGVALLMGHGRGPHNVLVLLDDERRVVVPCGNLIEAIGHNAKEQTR